MKSLLTSAILAIWLLIIFSPVQAQKSQLAEQVEACKDHAESIGKDWCFDEDGCHIKWGEK